MTRPNTTPVNENKATFAFEHRAQFRTLKIEYPRILLRADLVAILFDFVANFLTIRRAFLMIRRGSPMISREFLTISRFLTDATTMFARSKTPMYPWCNWQHSGLQTRRI